MFLQNNLMYKGLITKEKNTDLMAYFFVFV